MCAICWLQRLCPPVGTSGGLSKRRKRTVRKLVGDAERLPPEQFQELFRMCAQAEDSLRLSAHPRFALETAVVRATRLLSSKAAAAVEARRSSPPRVQRFRWPSAFRSRRSIACRPRPHLAHRGRPKPSQYKVSIAQPANTSDSRIDLRRLFLRLAVPPPPKPAAHTLRGSTSDEHIHAPASLTSTTERAAAVIA